MTPVRAHVKQNQALAFHLQITTGISRQLTSRIGMKEGTFPALSFSARRLVFPAASIQRAGPISILRNEPDSAISTYQVHLADGRAMSFDQFVNQVAMVDRIVIVHHGRIVYERYLHMDQSDKHLLFSVTKRRVPRH